MVNDEELENARSAYCAAVMEYCLATEKSARRLVELGNDKTDITKVMESMMAMAQMVEAKEARNAAERRWVDIMEARVNA